MVFQGIFNMEQVDHSYFKSFKCLWEILLLLNLNLPRYVPSINRHNVKWSEALFDLLLFEISSDMLEPLLLPFSEHNKAPEESAFFQV